MFGALYQSWQVAESMTSASIAERAARNAQTDVDSLQRQVKRLEDQVERLTLGTMALAELLRDQLGVPQGVLDAKVEEIDLRDGKIDKKVTTPLPVCPGCQRTNSRQRTSCLYCGKPLAAVALF